MVVVVVAMAENKVKGDLVAKNKRYVLRRSSSDNSDIVNQLYIGANTLEPETEYLVVIRGAYDDKIITEYIKESDKAGEQFNLPKKEIDTCQRIRPGETVDILVYELERVGTDAQPEQSELEDVKSEEPSKSLGSSRALKNENSPDDVQARLKSTGAKEYLDSLGGQGALVFRNTRTGMEATGVSHSNYTRPTDYVHFPQVIRKMIDASVDDIIALRRPEPSDEDGMKSNEQKIEEIHDMVSEMYGAYLSAKND